MHYSGWQVPGLNYCFYHKGLSVWFGFVCCFVCLFPSRPSPVDKYHNNTIFILLKNFENAAVETNVPFESFFPLLLFHIFICLSSNRDLSLEFQS